MTKGVMPGPSASALSRHFSKLVNRPAEFSPAPAAQQNCRPQVYAVYRVRPEESALVLQADLALFGSMAGAMLGLPDQEIAERLRTAPLDELIEDAMREICSVASGVLACDGRAAFRQFTGNKADLAPGAQLAIRQPRYSAHFAVEIDGYSGGWMSIFE